MFPFRRTCKEAAALMVAREDRSLAFAESTGLRLHLHMCRRCEKFELQMLTMRAALQRWRHYQEPDEAVIDPTPAPIHIQKK